MHYEHIRDRDREVIHTGDRVKILCPGSKKFYHKVGHVLLIDERKAKIFVQMTKDGGGMWWMAHGRCGPFG